jgi:hypothetical protein
MGRKALAHRRLALCTRADRRRLRCWDFRDVRRVIDRLEARSIILTAPCTLSTLSPSRSTLFTGRWPSGPFQEMRVFRDFAATQFP